MYYNKTWYYIENIEPKIVRRKYWALFKRSDQLFVSRDSSIAPIVSTDYS